MRATAAVLILLSVAIVAPPRAIAAPTGQSADEDATKREARALMREGVRLLGAGDAQGALALFRSAYAKFASAKILLNIGSTLKMLGRSAEAANAYQRYLDAPDTDPAKRTEVVALLADLDRQLGKLSVVIDVANAEVEVDGEWLLATSMKVVRVAPGAYELHARAANLPPRSATGEIAAGASGTASVTLEPKPVNVAAPAPSVLPLPEPVRGLADANLHPPQPHLKAPPASSDAQRTIGFVLGGVGVVGLATGAVVGTMARSSWNEASHLCDSEHVCTDDAQLALANQLSSTARTRGDLATVLVGGGALAVAAGASLWVTAPRTRAEVMGATGAVALIGGSIAGMLARSRWQQATNICGADRVCTTTAETTRANQMSSQARGLGNAATGLLAIGVAASSVAAALWLTAPTSPERSERVAPNVSVGGQAITFTLTGSF